MMLLAGSIEGIITIFRKQTQEIFLIFVIAPVSEIQKTRHVGIQQEVKVIERALKKRGITQSALAKELGIRVPAVTELFAGNRRLQLEEKEKAYKFLGLDSVPLKGYVGASQKATFYEMPEDELDRAPAPSDVTEDTVAVRIQGDSMGAPLNGWLVYYDHVQRPVRRELYDQLCVVGLPDGDVLLKQLKSSKTKGLFHLIPAVGETMLDRQVEWAAKVTGMRPKG